MAYPILAGILAEQIKVVFGLGGGELEDAPRRYYARKEGKGRRGWFRWWYPYLPEYAEAEFRRFGGSTSGDFFTVIWDSGSYGDHRPPDKILLTGGKVARKVAEYRSSGEAECPQEAWDPQEGECPICEGTHAGSEYIYLGEGWLEVVYRVRS